MKLYPSIDLMGGRCVRLRQGRFDAVSSYKVDPLTVARDYATAGASCLHLVDLDGAKNESLSQLDLMETIAKNLTVPVQAGGGIRTQAQVERCFKAGIWRVVVGSLAVTQPDLFAQWIKKFGPDRFTLAVDIRWDAKGIPIAATAGWTESGEKTLWQVLDSFLSSGLAQLLCTDISRDGTLEGPSFSLYQSIRVRYPALRVQASGGIGSLNDLKELKKVGVDAVVIGKALYEGRFTLDEALRC